MTVMVFDGDPIVGRALEVLLRTVGYDTRYVAHDLVGGSEAFEGVRVVLLGPRWSARSRQTVAHAFGDSTAAKPLILEFGSPPEGVALKPERYLPWPCRTDELKRRLNAAFLTEVGAADVEEDTA